MTTEHPHPNPHQDGREENKRQITGDVHVRGEVETKLPPDLAEQRKTERKEDKAEAKKRYVVELLTLAVVVIYAGLTGWQGCQTKTIINLTNRHFQIDQRPYITVSHVTFSDPDDPHSVDNPSWEPSIGHPIQVNITFKNVGKTPAENMFIHRRVILRSQLPKFTIDPENIHNGKIGGVLDAGQDTVTTAVSVKDVSIEEPFKVNPDHALGWDRIYPILVYGRVSYTDRFGNGYCTPFMMGKYPESLWVHEGGIKSPNRVFKWSDPCPEGLTHEAKN